MILKKPIPHPDPLSSGVNAGQRILRHRWVHPGRRAIRFAAVFGLLLALPALGPKVFALTPGPTLILQCTGCTNALRQFTIGSGNTSGAKFWTDGFMRAPMLPMLPLLVKCPHCKQLVWLDDAKELDQIDLFSNNKPWPKAKVPLGATESDYLEAANAAKITPAHELYARRCAWWMANDLVRDQPNRKVEWTDARKKNLTRLSALLDEKKDDQRLCKAEIARELGQFAQCLELLKRPVDEKYAQTAALVIRLAKDKQSQVANLP